MCGQGYDYFNSLPCLGNPVYHTVSLTSSRKHVFAIRSPAERQIFFHVRTSVGAGVSKGEVDLLYRLCRRVEDGKGSSTRPIQDAFKSKTSIMEAVQKEKERLLHLLGWMEGDEPAVLGPERLIIRSGILQTLKAVA